jgi:hypothetical protein
MTTAKRTNWSTHADARCFGEVSDLYTSAAVWPLANHRARVVSITPIDRPDVRIGDIPDVRVVIWAEK